MIGLPQKRNFLGSSWQILLTNNTLNLAILVGITFVGLMTFNPESLVASYVMLTVMYVSGASTFLLPVALLLLIIQRTRRLGGATLYLIASLWIMWLWLFGFTLLYQTTGRWSALLGFALSLVSSGLGLFAVFALFGIFAGQWIPVLTVTGAVILCRVASNAGKSLMGMKPSERSRSWVMAADEGLLGDTGQSDGSKEEISDNLSQAIERWREATQNEIEKTNVLVWKAYDKLTDDEYGQNARYVREYCRVLLASDVMNSAWRSKSDLPADQTVIMNALMECAEVAVGNEDESTIDLLRELYVSLGRFVSGDEATLGIEHNKWLMQGDAAKPFERDTEAEELRARIGNEEERLDEEFDTFIADAEKERNSAEVQRLQNEINGVKAEFEAELGLACWQNGDRESALRSYTRAITLDPENAVLLLNRGNLQLEMGHFENSIADLEKARNLDSSLPCDNLDLLRSLSPELREQFRLRKLEKASEASAEESRET